MYSYAYQLASVNSNLYIMQSIEKLIRSMDSCKCLFPQAPVVQTLDSAIHQINHYPTDKY